MFCAAVTIMKRLSAIILLATVLISVCQQTHAASCPFNYPNLANGTTCKFVLSGSTGLATYTLCCDTGYTMVGNTEAICDSNGVFTKTAGECKQNVKSAGVTASPLSQTVGIAVCFAVLLIARR